MESISNNAEHLLVDSLSFKLPGSGQYVTDRRSVTFHTEGSNSYSALNGTRVLKFRLNGEGWLDPSTVRLMFDVVNTDGDITKTLRPIGYCHGFFRRLRISVRGQIIEDIQDYTRVSHMFNIFQNSETRLNDMAEGFGYFDDIKELEEIGELPGIKSGSYQTVMFKPLCGIFNQTKDLPLRYMPIEIELELADNDAPIITDFNALYAAINTSKSWRIENCQIKCDIVSLDNSLDNSYVNHLLGGNTLKIVYDTYISSIQTITSADTQVNVSRSLTSLRSVFMSLDKNFTEARIKWCNKSWNTFYSTMIGNRDGPSNIKDSDWEIQHLQLSIGSKLYPEYPIKSHAECFYNLRKSLGVQANSLHAVDIKGNEYRTNKFVVGFDTERMLGLAFTGCNTKNSLMTVKFKTNGGDYQASRMHIVLVSQQVIDVSDSGVTIYD
jgi:hypothetical protein